MHTQVTNLSLPRSVSPTTVASQPYFGKADAPTTCRPATRQFAPVQSAPAVLHRNISSRFGERLRELRKQRQMTQLRMAIDFGIDRSFISDVERGRKSISLNMLEVIALGMNVELSDLLQGL
jgi:DNA-binding XRE family transcriptional regulator